MAGEPSEHVPSVIVVHRLAQHIAIGHNHGIGTNDAC